ncbi:MAG: FGGY-family carbohydrate kinase [Acidobacteriota bacterium]
MILSVDLGTQSFRATVLDKAGREVYKWSRAIESNREGAVAEQNPEDWRAALFDALGAIAAQPGLAAEICAVTCCATLSGLVCLDGEGKPMRPAILYADRRPASQLAAIESLDEYRASGWRAYSGDFLPQLAWLRSEHPQVYAGAHRFLDATGYLNFLLTGRSTLDRYTAFTCYADPREQSLQASLPTPLFAKLNIETNKLGEIVAPGAWIGPVLPGFGLERARVVSVSYDSTAAYLGSRIAEPGDALDISGTVTSFGVLTARRTVDAKRRVFSIPFGDRWLVRGSTAMSGGVLEWARRVLAFQDFDEFDNAVSAATPGSGGVLFLPYLAGARSPVWEPSACGVFHGLSAQTSRADMARAVYEGLCFSLQHIIETIETCGAPAATIQLGGGLSRNSLLNQMKADVAGKRVRPQLDTEVTTLGSASIAARALGWLESEESFCKAGPPIEPDATRHQEYARSFASYRELVARLFGSQ